MKKVILLVLCALLSTRGNCDVIYPNEGNFLGYIASDYYLEDFPGYAYNSP